MNIQKSSILSMISLGFVFIVIIGLAQDDKPKLQDEKIIIPNEIQQPLDQKSVLRPTIIEILTSDPVENGEIQKKFTHGDTEITYKVGVENGVEETPSPSVLKAMKDSYTEDEQNIISEYTKSMMFKRYNYGTVRILDIPMKEEYYHNIQIRINDKLKKDLIDSIFTCENFGDLAKKYVLEPLYTDGWAGSTENYIYTKAVNECIDPKMQERVDKVMKKLEEVHAEN